MVLDADGIEDQDLRCISVRTNLSECTFVLTPTTLDLRGAPSRIGRVVKECCAGLVPIGTASGGVLAFRLLPALDLVLSLRR
ncbi:hypothetical protein [Microbacterium azadirachtae]|uniref:hypothetical protein n=1 Tax=Microbacterium azadirachtae TaxID=582680 RepID=UPI0005ECE783|nr:hypothetical protein [Microbacterium azadirachtae]